MKNEKKVVVITLNYNHASDTIQCIESLLKSDYNNFEILLIDNGSEKVDFEELKKELPDDKRINLHRIEENRGYVGGINYGLKNGAKLNPDYFLIMNNDTIIDKGAMSALVETAEKYRGNAIVSGKVYNMDEPDTLQYVGQWCRNKNNLDYPPYIKDGREKDIGQYDKEMELDMTDDIFWLLSMTVFNKIGYYSTDFFLYGEQNDYALRAIKNGFKIVYTPKAKIWHYHHLTTSNGNDKSLRILYWRTYGILLLAFKHLSIFRFLYFYLKLFYQNINRYVVCIFLPKYKSKKSTYSTKLIALMYFTKWLLFSRKPNNGFNPLNKII